MLDSLFRFLSRAKNVVVEVRSSTRRNTLGIPLPGRSREEEMFAVCVIVPC